MIGGYLTFSGVDAKGKWHDTAVQEVLPVEVLTVDDERNMAQFVYRYLLSCGIQATIQTIDNKHANVIATIEGKSE